MTTTDLAPATRTVATRLERARALLRLAFTEHLGVTVLVLLGAALRIAVMIGYQPALWFSGDSGVYIRQSKLAVPPIDPFRPVGYTIFLKILGPTHTLFSVVALQHLLALAVVVAVYVFLQRRGLPRWLSCVAVIPLLFDSLQVTLEQFILVETLFTTVLLASFLALLWQRTPTMLACLIGGALFFGAWLTKPLALPLFGILVVYLLVRRVGWRKLTGFALTFVVPYLIVQALVSGHTSVYGSNSSAIYGRLASIADCDRVQLTPQERVLCPGPGQRNQRPDWYIWADTAPGSKFRGDASAYPAMRGFAIAVFEAQPGDYFRQVGKEIAAHFVPGIDLGWSFGCLRERFSLPATARDDRPIGLQCHAQLASADFKDLNHPWATNPPATPLTNALHGYAVAMRLSPVVLSTALLLTLLALFVRRRARTWLLRDAVMLMTASLALVILPVVIGMYEARYALPALPMVCMAGAMAVHYLRHPRRDRAGPQ
jgi:hypothetical protein